MHRLSDRGGNLSISVVIPCYNAQDTIEETLKRIIEQMTENMEIIVVDDGSTDNTKEIMAKYKGIVRYVSQENRGVSSARNHGVSIAQKEWIAFCDADDIWHVNKIQICTEVLKGFENCEFLFHDYSIFNNNRIVAERGTHSNYSFFPMLKYYSLTIPDILKQSSKIEVHIKNEKPTFIDIYHGNGYEYMILGNFILPSSVLIKKDRFVEKQGFDTKFKVAEDTELFLRLSKDIDFYYVDYPLHWYRRTGKSLISRFMKETISYGIRAIQKNCLNDREIARKYRKWIHLSLGRRFATLAYYNLTELEKCDAFKNALRSLRYEMFSFLPWKVLVLGFLPRCILEKGRTLKTKLKAQRSSAEKNIGLELENK